MYSHSLMELTSALSTVMMVTVLSWDKMVMAVPIPIHHLRLVKVLSSDELRGLTSLNHKRFRRVTKRKEEEQERRWN